jgi:hypothetical protein
MSGGKNSKKAVSMIRFREKYPSAKEPVGLDDIIFVYSRHVEAITLMTCCGFKEKK